MREPERGLKSRGSATLAALAVVAVLGVLLVVLQSVYPERNPRAQVGATGIVTETLPPPSAGGSSGEIKKQCNPGEVHTVDISDSFNPSPEDKTVKCYFPYEPGPYSESYPRGTMIPTSSYSSDPACLVSKPDKCVVRYCPPIGILNINTAPQSGCFVIKECDSGNSGSACLNDEIAQALKANTTNAANTLVAQGLAMNPDAQAYLPANSPPSSNSGTIALDKSLTPDSQGTVLQMVKDKVDVAYATADASGDPQDLAAANKLQALKDKLSETPTGGGTIYGLNSDLNNAGKIQAPNDLGDVNGAGGAAPPASTGSDNPLNLGGNPYNCSQVPRGYTTNLCGGTPSFLGARPNGTFYNNNPTISNGSGFFGSNGGSFLIGALGGGLIGYLIGSSQASDNTQNNPYGQPSPYAWQPTPPLPVSAAQLFCQPAIADVGMTIALSYSCAAGTASGSGFTPTTQPAGSATTTIASPPSSTNTATYALTCTIGSGPGASAASAQCSVEVNKPSIVLVGNPNSVSSGATSLIGWVTSGMQSCVISSPDQSDFTTRNANSTNVSGTAATSPITAAATFLLHCQTLGGSTKDATTSVSVK